MSMNVNGVTGIDAASAYSAYNTTTKAAEATAGNHQCDNTQGQGSGRIAVFLFGLLGGGKALCVVLHGLIVVKLIVHFSRPPITDTVQLL